MSKYRQDKFQVGTATLVAFRPALLAVAMGAAFVTPATFAFNSGSTGADGALAPTVNTEIQLPASGILNYTSINIPAGVVVKFRKNALNTPVYLLASGNVTIAGSIDISGKAGAATGIAGDGNQADDGVPGVGGPGGYDGGRGGRDDPVRTPAIVRGGAGLGPGGGRGGNESVAGSCGSDNRVHPYLGMSAGYATISGDGLNTNGSYVYCPNLLTVNVNGKAYGSAILQPLIGGSGGGGGLGGSNFPGSGGGGGGGALLIAASGTANIAGSIKADGGYGGDIAGPNVSGAGGAGSGGAVRIVATSVVGNGTITAQYGCVMGGAFSPGFVNCTIYRGAQGRIRIEADSITYSGNTTPGYSLDTPGPLFLSNLPSLRIATIAGSAVPLNPTGNADVTFPANIVNPVTVGLATTNVPTGNTVVVKVIPAYGDPQEVLSPAISGSAASGTASVQVNLPQGPSTLQAVTTYTVVVAMGEALSRFAQNERVDKVQLIASMGGENQAKLITISGKEYIVPVSVLQMVGFTG